MVDNDPNNDEYKLDDLDLLASEPEDQLQPEDNDVAVSSEGRDHTSDTMKPWENPMLRKSAIVLGGFFLVLLCYKMMSSFITGGSKKNEIMPVTVQQKSFEQHPSQQSTMNFGVTSDSGMAKKLNSLEQEQSNMNSTLQTVNNQVSSMNSTVSDVSSKISALSAHLTALSDRLDTQTREIERLTALNTKRHTVKYSRIHQRGLPSTVVMYSIQAIIPGRAWLIASNGSSMTVREGSPVAGYGVVRLIDAERGRILTSSGRIIRFSQVDS